MADHVIALSNTDSRPKQIKFHVGASPSFEWTPPTGIAWLDIAAARVEILDQLRSDRLVVDAPLTLDNTNKVFTWTLDSTQYPIRATRYKMRVEIEKTDGSFVEYPGDDPGYTQLVAHAEGEDPLNLTEIHQNILNANALLGEYYNAMRNPPNILVVDKVYEGYEIAGRTYSDPVSARDYAVAYIEAQLVNEGQLEQVLIVLHADGEGATWSEDPAAWYPSYVAGPYDQLVKYYASIRRAERPAPQVFVGKYGQSGTDSPTLDHTVAGGIKPLSSATDPSGLILTRLGVGRYRVGLAGVSWIPGLPHFPGNIDNKQLAISVDVLPFNSGNELAAIVTVPFLGSSSQPPEIQIVDDSGNNTDDWEAYIRAEYYAI